MPVSSHWHYASIPSACMFCCWWLPPATVGCSSCPDPAHRSPQTNLYRSAKAQFLCLEAGQTLRHHLCSRASGRNRLHLGFHLTSHGCLASSLSLSYCPPSLTGHPRKPSLINHIHSNVWLRVCFWKNLLSDALGRLLTLQLCTSLLAILFLSLLLFIKKLS